MTRRDRHRWLGHEHRRHGILDDTEPWTTPNSGRHGALEETITDLDEAREQLAPTGVLRAAINLGNPVLARRDDAGEPTGVSVDLAHELGRRLAAPVRLVAVETAAASVALVSESHVDVGFFAVDAARAATIAFTAPYVLIEGCYLVAADSPVRAHTEVDVPGRRVVVGAGSAYDLFLSRELRQASIERAPSSQEVVSTFLATHADVAAGVRQQLQADLAALGTEAQSLRLLPEAFMVIRQAMGVSVDRDEAAAAVLRDFVEDAKASGLVAAALRRAGVHGALVAPPA